MTFQFDRCKRGQAFWPRRPKVISTGPNGVWPTRAELRRLKASGVDWLALSWQDEWYTDRGWEWPKYDKRIDTGVLIPLIETCNAYGLRTVLRSVYPRHVLDGWWERKWNLDPVVESLARIFPHVSRRMNCFQPVAECGILTYPFSPEQRKNASIFLEDEYGRWIPTIREICPDLTVVLSQPSWGKPWTGDHLDMVRNWKNTIRAHEYPKEAKEIQAMKEYWAERNEVCMFVEVGTPEHVEAGVAAGVATALWRDR